MFLTVIVMIYSTIASNLPSTQHKTLKWKKEIEIIQSYYEQGPFLK